MPEFELGEPSSLPHIDFLYAWCVSQARKRPRRENKSSPKQLLRRSSLPWFFPAPLFFARRMLVSWHSFACLSCSLDAKSVLGWLHIAGARGGSGVAHSDTSAHTGYYAALGACTQLAFLPVALVPTHAGVRGVCAWSRC